MDVRARVIIQEKGLYTLSYEGTEKKAEVSGKYRYEAGSISDFPAVGDYVVASWPEDESHAIISTLFPRKSVFIRKAAGNTAEEQVVAANIDTIFICMSLNQDFNLRRLERYLTISWDSGAVPVILLTKSDLCEDLEKKLADIGEVAPGVEVITTSAQKEETQALKDYLVPGKTYALIGSSGVGKSTLINALMGENVLKTSEIREDDDKGRHTTTHRQLIALENGAYVVDTPGMRELGLWNNEEGVETTFADIEELITGCKFSNCTHTNEPGCQVLQALEDGRLLLDRWNSYLKLMTENRFTANEGDYLRAKKEKFKQIAKINKKRR